MKLKEKLANAKTYVQQNQRKFILMMCSIVVIGGIVAGTLAWLAARTNPVINNFIGSNLTIDLSETTKEYSMIPGDVIKKDPMVTVKEGSEACWLFLQVKESPAQANGSGITQTRSGPEYKYLDYTIITKNEDRQNADDLIWRQLQPNDVSTEDNQITSFPEGVSYYCCEVEITEGTALPKDVVIPILKDNQVQVCNYIINEELDSERLKTNPVTITFTPVAIQKLGFSNVANAFSMVQTELKRGA